MQDIETVGVVLGLVGTACWVVCFWWMHRISSSQGKMLKELHEVTQRIEKLSQEERDLIEEVQPAVEEIKEAVQNDNGKPGEERSPAGKQSSS